MSPLPPFYHSVVPLDRNDHRGWALVQPQRFAFARKSHLVPALVDEIGPACRHLPVVFLPESAGPVPVFLVGAAPGRNNLVDADGAWSGRYLPAYLRRYPFILGESAGSEPLICLDAESDLVRRGSPPEADPTEPAPEAAAEAPSGTLPLFGPDGAETPLLQERIRLVVDYAEAARRTAGFGRLLQDLGLLRALTIQVRHPATGESHTLHGTMGVDEAALAGLPPAGFARLHGEGLLPAVYAHLISLQAVSDFLVPASVGRAAAGGSPDAAQPTRQATANTGTDDA